MPDSEKSSSATCYVVVTFDRNADGELRPGERLDMPSARVAKSMAHYFSRYHAGVARLAHSGDLATGVFEDAVVLISIGDVDATALTIENKS